MSPIASSLVFRRREKSTAQVDTGSPTSSLTETPPLLAPNVSDWVELPLQPRFTGEREVRQYRFVRGMNMPPRNAERVTLTSLAPCTMKIKDVLPDGNITTVGAKCFRCVEVFASGFYEISLQTS